MLARAMPTYVFLTKHMREVHGQEYTDEELQEDHLQVV